MSDPIAVSILAKLTSWYGFENNVNDSHGTNNLNIGVTVAGYGSGVQGQELLANSIGAVGIASPVTLDGTHSACIGGWVDYTLAGSSTTVASLSYNFAGQNEGLALNANSLGSLIAASFGGSSEASVSYGARNVIRYPLTVAVNDSASQTAYSAQEIDITTTTPQPGKYFMVAQWMNGQIQLWTSGVLRGTATVPTPYRSGALPYFQVGNQYTGSKTPCGLDELFYCGTQALTAQEIGWLYNNGAGVSYAQLVAAAS